MGTSDSERSQCVLQVVLSLHPGGTERLVVALAKRLHATLPMAVCCLDDAGAWAEELRIEGITVTELRRSPGFQPSLGRRVAEAAKAHGATVVHAHQYSPFVYGGLSRLFGSGVRVVFTEHGRLSDAGPSPKRRLANRALRGLAHQVFAVSEDVKAHLVAEGFADDAVGVIYNGIDVGPLPTAEERRDVRLELGVSRDALVLATIGRLDPVKDFPTLLEVLSGLDALDVTLLIIGDGPERAALEDRARQLGLHGRARFLGHREDARRWLAGCDVYVNSSISEGVSLTILEAMAAGLPIVATRVGGTPEVVTEDCGVLVPAREPGALADAVRTLSTDPAGRARMATAARARVEAHFTLARMIDDYRRVYES